jgi:hypothetical protein
LISGNAGSKKFDRAPRWARLLRFQKFQRQDAKAQWRKGFPNFLKLRFRRAVKSDPICAFALNSAVLLEFPFELLWAGAKFDDL